MLYPIVVCSHRNSLETIPLNAKAIIIFYYLAGFRAVSVLEQLGLAAPGLSHSQR